MLCANGLNVLFIRYEGQKIQLLEGHGVGVVDKDEDKGNPDEPWFKEIGCIDFETDTIVGKSGGAALLTGDLIIHTAEICRDGLRRYNA